MNKIKTLHALIICLLLGQLTAHAANTVEQPISQIKATVEQAILVINNKQLQGTNKYHIRQEKLFALVDERFNFPLMGKLALGKIWLSVDLAERDHFVKLFSELLKNSYIRRVDSYTNAQIFFTKQTIRKNLALVYSHYEKNNEKFSINYKMQKNNNGQWLVFDVEIEGASVVKQYRKQFQGIIKRNSMQMLNKRLKEKVNALIRVSEMKYNTH